MERNESYCRDESYLKLDVPDVFHSQLQYSESYREPRVRDSSTELISVFQILYSK